MTDPKRWSCCLHCVADPDYHTDGGVDHDQPCTIRGCQEPGPRREAAYIGDVAPRVRAIVLDGIARPELKASQDRASRITGEVTRLLLDLGLLSAAQR